jgi:RNA polymerase sigma-70 factor (ECF subfamily)
MIDLTATGNLTGTVRWHVVEQAGSAEWTPALDETYRELAPAVLGYFRSHRVDQAEDLVGDVFVSVARNLRRFRGNRDDLRRWVFAIAHRRRVDHLRRRRVRRGVIAEHPPERACIDAQRDLDVDLIAALAALTTRQREVVVLRFVVDLPLEDVARIVGRRVGAVKALQARALDRLAHHLDPPNPSTTT